MIFSNLDSIVRRYLLEKGLPIHWYAECLFHASTCLRELTFDTLQITNTVRLPRNDYYAVDLPEDFVDDVMVGVPAGQFIQPIPKNDGLTPLRLTDTDGNYTTYENNTSDILTLDGLSIPALAWYWNFNEYGESTGRYFGMGGGANPNTYKVIRERRQIQLPENFIGNSIILVYLSDGQSVDAATQVSALAFWAIQSWIAWKSTPNAQNNFAPEGQYFINEKRKLRARLNDLTINDVKDLIRRQYRATIKN